MTSTATSEGSAASHRRFGAASARTVVIASEVSIRTVKHLWESSSPDWESSRPAAWFSHRTERHGTARRAGRPGSAPPWSCRPPCCCFCRPRRQRANPGRSRPGPVVPAPPAHSALRRYPQQCRSHRWHSGLPLAQRSDRRPRPRPARPTSARPSSMPGRASSRHLPTGDKSAAASGSPPSSRSAHRRRLLALPRARRRQLTGASRRMPPKGRADAPACGEVRISAGGKALSETRHNTDAGRDGRSDRGRVIAVKRKVK